MNDLKRKLALFFKQVLRYRVLIFVGLLVVAYGFVMWRVSVLANVQPSQTAASSTSPSTPHIDPSTINKIKQLQDNSVSVQALFNQARQNPFNE